MVVVASSTAVGGGCAVGGFHFLWDVQWLVAMQWIGGCDVGVVACEWQ